MDKMGGYKKARKARNYDTIKNNNSAAELKSMEIYTVPEGEYKIVVWAR